MKVTMRRAVTACALAVATASTSAGGQESDTLTRIKRTNTITIGYRIDSIPFSYVDSTTNKQEPIGYSIDICMKIVNGIKTALNLPRLTVRFRTLPPALRIPSVANGTIDMECGSSTNTIERQQQVAFALTTFVTSTRLMWKKGRNMESVDDLRGKTVVAAAGTTNIQLMTEINAQRGLRMTIIPAKDGINAFAMLDKGQADAFAASDIFLYSLIVEQNLSAGYAISNDALMAKPYGIMLRKNDPAFKQMADDIMRELFKSGEIETIYTKWFLSPIPPNNVKLDVPMSASLKKVIGAPSDSSVLTD